MLVEQSAGADHRRFLLAGHGRTPAAAVVTAALAVQPGASLFTNTLSLYSILLISLRDPLGSPYLCRVRASNSRSQSCKYSSKAVPCNDRWGTDAALELSVKGHAN